MTRESFLPFSRPDFGEGELDFVRLALESGWVTTGPLTHRFEREFSERVGAAHAVAVNSCTAAMHLALEAIGLGPGDEVITSPYTFAATAEVVRYFGARPRFVDVEPDTLNLDPAAVAEAITPRTRAVLPVHVAGHPADLGPLDPLPSRMVSRSSRTPRTRCRPRTGGTPIGSTRAGLQGVPHLVCYSFYATKTLDHGRGGDGSARGDEALAERCRLMSLHGITKNAWNRYARGDRGTMRSSLRDYRT